MKAKPGVLFIFPHPGLLLALDVVHIWWRATFAKDPVVTSGRDGEHGKDSLHYGSSDDFRERAFDVRTRDLNRVEQLKAEAELARLLGPLWDVVLEADHLHLEIDLRNIFA